MSEVVGDVSELHKNSISARAVIRLEGPSGAFHLALSKAQGFNKYFESHAKVSIVGPLKVSVTGPVTSTIAIRAVVAVIPDKYTDFPTEEGQIHQLQGATTVLHSLLVPVSKPVVAFGNETTEQLKPRTLVDYPPVVVGHFTVAGGNATTVSHLVVEATLALSGVAHHKTW